RAENVLGTGAAGPKGRRRGAVAAHDQLAELVVAHLEGNAAAVVEDGTGDDLRYGCGIELLQRSAGVESINAFVAQDRSSRREYDLARVVDVDRTSDVGGDGWRRRLLEEQWGSVIHAIHARTAGSRPGREGSNARVIQSRHAE